MSREAPARPASESVVLAAGLRASRATLERWRRDPGPVLRPWFGGASAVALLLLAAVWAVSLAATPDPTPALIPGLNAGATAGDYLAILGRNLLVLALHATACVAGFIAGSSMRQVAATKRGISRTVHEHAGPVAIGWVAAVTAFSLLSQALGLGITAAALSLQLGIGSGTLILTVLPHALIELTAVFLPLAAWLIASRRDEWAELLAATIVTAAVAIPMLLVAALVELTVWPRLVELVAPYA